MASETENLVAQGESCCALGVIYNKRGDFERSVHYFERNFEISRSISKDASSSASLVDIARVYLGMARGNQMLKRYVHTINHDMKGLLAWKTRRIAPATS